ncbi:MAG TPA: hypothetical protein VHU85_08415 [Acidimicrobiales bacterium]|jgi:hypothetical protein|nr:hypothetical protein [Acidimicrobiales bacterium]
MDQSVSARESCSCDCEFYRQAPKKHDMLVGIESMDLPLAAKLMADLISDNEMGVGNEKPLIDDPNDWTRFVAQHNWRDPVGMYLFAESADFATEQAWMHRMSTRTARVA